MNTAAVDAKGLVVTCARCGQRNRLAYERLREMPKCAKCRLHLSLPGQPIDIEDEVSFEALTARSALPVLIDFWAPWCGPCKMVAPEISKIAAEGTGRWVVAKLNTEQLPAPAQRLCVSAIPLLVLFHQGRELARQAGALPAHSIRQFLQPHV